MLKNSLCYPYPILRTTSIDFKESILDTKISKEIIDNEYVLTVDVETNNNQITRFINEGFIIKALFVESGALKYKRMFNVTVDNKVRIPCDQIYGKVELQVCLICNQNIDTYYNTDFNEDFQGFNISLSKGDIIGLGDAYEFDALLEKDNIKNISSIFIINEAYENYMSYDISGDQVIIYLPKELKNEYETIRQMKDTYPILNSMIVFPVLCELVRYCLNDETDSQWYFVLKKKIHELIEAKIINKNENDHFKIAQIIVDSLHEKGLLALDQIIRNAKVGGNHYEN